MVLSKRERSIAIATVAAMGLLIVDHYVLDPVLAARSSLDTKIGIAQQELEKSRRTFANSRRKRPLWAEMQKKGLRSRAQSDAEGQVLNSIRDWAQDAGLNLSSVKPERTETEKVFQKSSFRATGTGDMRQISRFLWRIQTAELPMRINDLQINARKEGTDDLALQVGISTIYLAPETGKPQPAAAGTLREVQP